MFLNHVYKLRKNHYRKQLYKKCLLLIILLILSLSGCGKENLKETSQEVFAMDTYMTVTAYGSRSAEAVSEAVAEIERLDALWSVGKDDSEIARINTEGSLKVSPETGNLIDKALSVYKETDGAFDITIYPLMEEWGFTTQEYSVPSPEKIRQLLKKVDAGSLVYDPDTGNLTLPEGVRIDLGGIAKGYTSAHIMEIFDKYDIVSGLVSLGGNVQAYHRKPDGSNWRVGVENPDPAAGQLSTSDYVGVLELEDKAAITSGGYERYFEKDGKIYHHILDPSTGYPADQGLISVTIVSDDGCLADCLSTSLFVMGLDKSLEYWRKHQDDFDAIFVDREGRIFVTSGLKEIFSTDLKYELVE